MGTGRGATGRRLVAVVGGMLLVGALSVGPAFGDPIPPLDPGDGGSTPGLSDLGDLSGGGSVSNPVLPDSSGSAESLPLPSVPSYSAPTVAEIPEIPGYSSESSLSEFETAQEDAADASSSSSTTTTTSSSAGQCQALANAISQGSAQFQNVLDQIEATPIGTPLGSLLTQLEAARTQFETASQQFFNNPLCAGSGGSGTGGSGTEIRYVTDPGSSYGSAPGIYSPYGGYAEQQQPLYQQPLNATQVGTVPRGGVATGDGSFEP